MGQPWENPDYARQRRRQRRRMLVPLLLALIVAAAFWSLRNNAPGKASAAAKISPRSPAVADSARNDPLLASAANPAAEPPGTPPLGDPGDFAESDAPPPATGGSETFADRKAQAFSLYRQNDLPGAQEQAQAALALRRDEELIELLLQLRREIRVQRNYDNARTAHFSVLFDGYEHEEMKVAVLDILKDAYAGVGKALNHFPSEPVTVILYTGKDFSDITRAPDWAGGMFGMSDGKIRLPVQGAEGHERMLRRVVTHEYVHALLHSLVPATPL